ncbi:DUF2971 domain-containing protein [Pseudomonas plecoglossicida]|uniref:DUF2971 domain-containing protein n=1 Tax=Pseudomonas plecoglossicida TaxID=70775 RepID=UPI0009DD8272|nr:DUF2971 domain-containing protein [Pseudomonas plecoglossicida]GLR37937.1 hypothetical protein GCM10011247_33350 [Pseudomonas plecoglossicida]
MEAPKNLYKYMGPDISNRFLVDGERCTIKLSYLKDYNDPFEFFLTIDYNQEPEILAYYNEIISMVTQQPVTCFSKSPISTPMWAHYASNSQGFVAEINETALNQWLDSQEADPSFGDIDYRDTPSEGILNLLQQAYVTCKPRHTGWLWQSVGARAYFTKQTCWSYEQERRLITSKKVASKINDNLSLLYFPSNCVTAIIAGAKASNETKETLKEVAKSANCKYFEMHIGKSSTSPFLLDSTNNTHVFQNGGITPHPENCDNCKEPKTNQASKLCSWCNINERHENNAASRNAFRTLNNAGILDMYLDRFLEIGKNLGK